MIVFNVKRVSLGEVVFTNRVTQIKWQSFRIQQALTKQVDTCAFSVEQYQSKGYVPAVGDEIQVISGGVTIFAGFVGRVTQDVMDGYTLVFSCEARDYQADLLDRKLVAQTYTGMTEAAIIADILTNYAAPGITTAGVDGTNVVASITFNNVPVSSALQTLCQIYNKDWYLDYAKDLKYFSKLSQPAPFDVADDTDTYIPDTLEVVNDATQIKNSVFVEGGNELSTSTYTDKLVGDGITYNFPLSYVYKNATMTIGGVAKTLGVDGLDDPLLFDALINYEGKLLKFPSGSPPAASADIRLTANYYFPIKTLIRNSPSIAIYGERQFQIVDKAITDRLTAKQRASAELYAYAAGLQEGKFNTYKAGLRAGQTVVVNSTISNIADSFLINRLNITMYSPNSFMFEVTLVSVKTFEMIDLLAQIVKSRDASTSLNPVILTAEAVAKSIGVQRTFAVRTPLSNPKGIGKHPVVTVQFNFSTIWVAGPYFPTPDVVTDHNRVAFADSGCLLRV